MEADQTALLLAVVALLSMTWHLVDYERGAPRSGTDFAVTLAGIIYLGWIGAYLVSLRILPEGQWWVLIAPARSVDRRFLGLLPREAVWQAAAFA